MFSLQNIPFYIFSESYGGKMAAAISLELTEVHEKSWVFTGFQVRMWNDHKDCAVEVNLSALHQQLVTWRKSWLCFFRLCYSGRSTREGQVQLCWCSARRLLDFPSRSVSHWVHIHTVTLPLTVWGGVCPHSPNPNWLLSRCRLCHDLGSVPLHHGKEQTTCWVSHCVVGDANRNLCCKSLLDEAGLADVSRAADAVRKAVEQQEFDKATALWSVTETVVEQVRFSDLKMAIFIKWNNSQFNHIWNLEKFRWTVRFKSAS